MVDFDFLSFFFLFLSFLPSYDVFSFQFLSFCVQSEMGEFLDVASSPLGDVSPRNFLI
jgi:hypothetical protein